LAFLFGSYSISTILLGNGEGSVLLLLGVDCVVRCLGFGSGAVCVLGSWGAFVLDADGALSVCILRPHYLGCFGCLFLEVFHIYAVPVVFTFSFFRECLCVLYLLDENNICHFRKKLKNKTSQNRVD
jgi:hypothetical protein